MQARTGAKHEAELLLLRDKTSEQAATIADLSTAKSDFAKLTEQYSQLVMRCGMISLSDTAQVARVPLLEKQAAEYRSQAKQSELISAELKAASHRMVCD